MSEDKGRSMGLVNGYCASLAAAEEATLEQARLGTASISSGSRQTAALKPPHMFIFSTGLPSTCSTACRERIASA